MCFDVDEIFADFYDTKTGLVKLLTSILLSWFLVLAFTEGTPYDVVDLENCLDMIKADEVSELPY